MKTSWKAVTCAALFSLASGCYQQQLRVAVHEDGGGTIQITERITPPGAGLIVDAPSLDREKRIHAALIQELASWDGIAAWRATDAKIDGDSVVLAAKGYFEDVRRLRRDGLDSLTHAFAFRRDGGTTALEWIFGRHDTPPANTLERCRAIVTSLKDVRIEASITMPGALIPELASTASTPSTVKWVLFSGADLDEELRALEARLAAGKITERELIETIQKRFARTDVVRCRTGESTAARERFYAELDDAVAEYSGSELAREIEKARLARGAVSPELR